MPKPQDFSIPAGRDERARLMLGALHRLTQVCTACELGRQPCDEHYTIFDPHVFSTMTLSRWMIVGQNPGYYECMQKQPFVGEAGKFFDAAIEKHGLKRSDFYITNAVHCHTIGNTKPEFLHKQRCEPILRMEVQAIRPRLVTTLGSTAFNVFFPSKVMSDNLGEILHSDKFDVDVYPVYHPSPLNMKDKKSRELFLSHIKDLCELVKQCRK